MILSCVMRLQKGGDLITEGNKWYLVCAGCIAKVKY